MDPKPDKEWEKGGDIGLLSEIIANSIYWQGIKKNDDTDFSGIYKT